MLSGKFGLSMTASRKSSGVISSSSFIVFPREAVSPLQATSTHFHPHDLGLRGLISSLFLGPHMLRVDPVMVSITTHRKLYEHMVRPLPRHTWRTWKQKCPSWAMEGGCGVVKV